MQIAKQAADLLTFSRGLIAIVLICLSVTQGAEGLPLAVGLLILSWTTDALDGPLARLSAKQVHSWIGDRDLEIDMAVSCGLLIYMVITMD